MKKQKTIFWLKVFIPAIFLYWAAFFLAFGSTNYFEVFIWMSPLFHSLGGASMAWLVLLVYGRYKKALKITISPQWVLGLLVVGIVGLIGIAWELHEFVLDQILGLITQLGVGDTLMDLGMDIIGAWVLFVLYRDK